MGDFGISVTSDFSLYSFFSVFFSACSPLPTSIPPSLVWLDQALALNSIIYCDFISHEEMFSDIYKVLKITDRLCLKVEGKMASRIEAPLMAQLLVAMPPLKVNVLKAQ